MNDRDFWKYHDDRINREIQLAGKDKRRAEYLSGLSYQDFKGFAEMTPEQVKGVADMLPGHAPELGDFMDGIYNNYDVPPGEEDHRASMQLHINEYNEALGRLAKETDETDPDGVKREAIKADLGHIRSKLDNDIQNMKVSDKAQAYAKRMWAENIMSDMQQSMTMFTAMCNMKKEGAEAVAKLAKVNLTQFIG